MSQTVPSIMIQNVDHSYNMIDNLIVTIIISELVSRDVFHTKIIWNLNFRLVLPLSLFTYGSPAFSRACFLPEWSVNLGAKAGTKEEGQSTTNLNKHLTFLRRFEERTTLLHYLQVSHSVRPPSSVVTLLTTANRRESHCFVRILHFIVHACITLLLSTRVTIVSKWTYDV